MVVAQARLLDIDGIGFDDVTPIVESASAIDSVTVEVAFNTSMLRDVGGGGTDALDIANYSIPGLTIASAAEYTPNRIRLTVNEMVQGTSYTVTVAGTLESTFGKVIDATRLAATFTGVGIAPTVTAVNQFLNGAGTNVRIFFSEGMDDNAALSLASNYVFTETAPAAALTPTVVTPEVAAEPTFVDVTVNPMTNQGAYNVLVKTGTGITDAAGNAVDPNNNDIDFTGFQDVVSPKVETTIPQDNVTVRIKFSEDMNQNTDLLSASTYNFSGGLRTLGVTIVDTDEVDVTTSPQVGSKEYTVVVSTIVRDLLGNNLDPNNTSADFLGLSTPAGAFVQELRGLTHPDGNRIDLEWTNPPGTVANRIVRKTRGFPFDKDDGFVVYDSTPITEFTDTDQLQDSFFYYYSVLASTDGTTFPLSTELSNVEVLSIRDIGSGDWIYDHLVPAWHKEKQLTIDPPLRLLRPVVDTLGAALNLLRGELEAFRNSADQDTTTIRMLPSWNRAYDFAPEESFDTSVLRRIPLHILDIYKRKSTEPALCFFVEIFTEWECIIVEFGQSGAGGTILKTWDGASEKDVGQGDSGALTVQRGLIADGSKSFTTDQWAGGFVIDGMGNVITVVSNTATNIVLVASDDFVETGVTSSAASGQPVIPVMSTDGFSQNTPVLIFDGTNFQVGRVLSISPGVSITLQEDLQFAFGTDALVSRQPDVIDAEIVGTGTQVSASGLDGLRDTTKAWVENQWKGYKLLDSTNALFDIDNNDADDVFVVSGTPAAGDYAIAVDFTVGGSFTLRDPEFRYAVYNGEHYFLFEPAKSLTLAGTALDPFDRLYGGLGIGAGFTPDDLAIFINPGIAVVTGSSTDVVLKVLTDTDAAFTPDALVGKFLNPNRKQSRLFTIVANTATTITVTESIEGLSQTGDFYFVLEERDSLKYARLNANVKKLIPKFTNAFVFFE